MPKLANMVLLVFKISLSVPHKTATLFQRYVCDAYESARCVSM